MYSYQDQDQDLLTPLSLPVKDSTTCSGIPKLELESVSPEHQSKWTEAEIYPPVKVQNDTFRAFFGPVQLVWQREL